MNRGMCSWLLGTNRCTYGDSLSYCTGKLIFSCCSFNAVLIHLGGCAVRLVSHSVEVMLRHAVRAAGGTQVQDLLWIGWIMVASGRRGPPRQTAREDLLPCSAVHALSCSCPFAPPAPGTSRVPKAIPGKEGRVGPHQTAPVLSAGCEERRVFPEAGTLITAVLHMALFAFLLLHKKGKKPFVIE